MFSCCQVGGITAGFPDVCKTPVPPVPHPNVGMAGMTIPIPVQVLTIGGPKHRNITGAFTYICKGAPVTRLTYFGITILIIVIVPRVRVLLLILKS